MVCVEYEEKGHKSIHPPLRAFEKCIDEQKQCFKVVVLFYSADSKSKNKSAGELFNQEKEKEDPNPLVLLNATMCPYTRHGTCWQAMSRRDV